MDTLLTLAWLIPWAITTLVVLVVYMAGGGLARKVFLGWPTNTLEKICQCIFWGYLASGWILLVWAAWG